eukprot:123104_1
MRTQEGTIETRCAVAPLVAISMMVDPVDNTALMSKDKPYPVDRDMKQMPAGNVFVVSPMTEDDHKKLYPVDRDMKQSPAGNVFVVSPMTEDDHKKLYPVDRDM